MSLGDCRALFANDKEVARRRSGVASRDNDAVIHKKCRQACRRINQCFLNPIELMPSVYSQCLCYKNKLKSY